MGEIVVCGGSVVGSVAAMLLARDGHAVTVLEADPSEVPEPSAAWESWERRGVAQFRQANNLFARARQIMDAELPGLTDALLEAGCVWVDPLASAPPAIRGQARRPDDDRLRYVTGRRPVVEAVLARAARSEPGVTVRRGAAVRGLVSDGDQHVRGVVLENGERLRADLVVDATGRRSRLDGWLREIGARSPLTESADCGFMYFTRYFQGPELPATYGPPAANLGTFSLLTIPGDNGTWSITAWAASGDTALRGLRDPERFARVVAACPLQAHWLAGEPITGVLPMAGVLDRYRRFVVDDQPVATGVLAIGDAWGCTNPSAARGVSVGLLHAQRLRDVVRAEGMSDPDALARHFDAVTERDVTPFYRDQLVVDRARLAELDALREGAEPPPGDPMARAVGAAMMQDPEVFRGVLETVLCLALPAEVFARPGIWERIDAHAGGSPMSLPAPSRGELLALLR